MGFKMKGFSAGKGTGSSFTYGEHVTQPDGSVIWTPPKEEYVEPPKEKSRWDKKVEKHIAKYENAKINNEVVPYSTLRILNQYDPDWLSKQNYHTLSNLDNVSGLDFDDNVKRYNRKGEPIVKRKNKRYNKFREKGMSHEEAMDKANIQFDPKVDDSTTHRSDRRQVENQWEEDPNIVVNSKYDDPNISKPEYIAPELTQDEIEEIEKVDAETALIDAENKKNEKQVIETEKDFDSADTNEDGTIDMYEAKAEKRRLLFADNEEKEKPVSTMTKKSAFTVLSRYGKKWGV